MIFPTANNIVKTNSMYNLQNVDLSGCSGLFSHRVINRWNKPGQGVVDASTINAFKGWSNKTRETRMGFFMD